MPSLILHSGFHAQFLIIHKVMKSRVENCELLFTVPWSYDGVCWVNPHVYHEYSGASGLSNNPRMDLMSLWWCMFWLILMCTVSILEHLDSQKIQEWIGIIERVVVMLRLSIAVFYPATVNKSRPTLELISVLLQAFFLNINLATHL